jgi:hypothetical protein
MILDYAQRAAASNGSGEFDALEFVHSTRGEANLRLMQDDVGENAKQPVAIVEIRGAFRLDDPANRTDGYKAPYFIAVVDTVTGEPTDFTLAKEHVELAQFGEVHKLR